MSNLELSKQLAKRILLNFGVWNSSAVIDENHSIKKLRIQDSKNINEYNVFCAQNMTGESNIEVIISNISENEEPDLVVIIKQDNVLLSIRYTNNFCAFFVRSEILSENYKWVDMPVLYQLNLAAGIELLTQEGYPWLPVNNPNELYEILVQSLA